MRCRMRCWDIWRCWWPIKKYIPVESVAINGWDASETKTFEAQSGSYYASFSISVNPSNATNKMVTITSSNPSVINRATYDSSDVTFTIEWEWTAEVTITSQDNAEISTTYSVEVTPAPEPFQPNNSILVMPGWNTKSRASNTSAIVRFFATDENSTDYVQARFWANNKLTYISYHWACEWNEYCETMFSDESIKEELWAKVWDYIDEYWIPESWTLEFTSSMWSSIESYFNWESTVEDVVDNIEESWDIVEPVIPPTPEIHVESISNVPESLNLMTDVQGTFTFNYSPTNATAPDEDISFGRDETFVWIVVWEFNGGTCTAHLQTGSTAWDWFVEIYLGENITTIPVSVSNPDTISINTTLTTTQVEVWQLAQIYFLANDTFTLGDVSQWLSNTELVSGSWEWYNYIYKGTVTASWEHTFTITWNTMWDSDSIVITCTNPTPPSDYVNIIWVEGIGGYEGDMQDIFVYASGNITATSDDVMVAEVDWIDDTPWTWTEPDTGIEYNYTHTINLSTHDAWSCTIRVELSSDPTIWANQNITVYSPLETMYDWAAGTVMWNSQENYVEIGHNVVDPDDWSVSVESVRYTNYVVETDWDTVEDWGPAYFQYGNCTAFRWTIPNTNTQVNLANLSQDDLDNIVGASYFSPDFVTNAVSWAEPLEDIANVGLDGTWIAEPEPLGWWRLPTSGEIDIINAFRNEAMQDQDWNDEYLGILQHMMINIAWIVDPTCTLDPNDDTHYWTQESQIEYDQATGTTAIWWNATAFYYDSSLWEFACWDYATTNWFCLIWFQDVI